MPHALIVAESLCLVKEKLNKRRKDMECPHCHQKIQDAIRYKIVREPPLLIALAQTWPKGEVGWVRVYNALEAMEVFEEKDLLDISGRELLKRRNFGLKTLFVLNQALVNAKFAPIPIDPGIQEQYRKRGWIK